MHKAEIKTNLFLFHFQISGSCQVTPCILLFIFILDFKMIKIGRLDNDDVAVAVSELIYSIETKTFFILKIYSNKGLESSHRGAHIIKYIDSFRLIN